MMEAARTSETLLNFYQTTRHYNPEASHLCTHRCENLKSYIRLLVFTPPLSKSALGFYDPHLHTRNLSMAMVSGDDGS
jgi:hypothetical protein